MARADREIIESFLNHVCEQEKLEKPNILYVKYEIGSFNLIGLAATYHADSKTILFNTDYFHHTTIYDSLHELGHHKDNLDNPDFKEWEKKRKEESADQHGEKWYALYRGKAAEIIEEAKPRHWILKVNLHHGLHLWIPNSGDITMDQFNETHNIFRPKG